METLFISHVFRTKKKHETYFLAMFPEGGQSRHNGFVVMSSERRRTWKHCFLAMFSDGGQTRIIAIFPLSRQTKKVCLCDKNNISETFWPLEYNYRKCTFIIVPLTYNLLFLEASERITNGASVVQAGLEPSCFTTHFPFWKRRQDIAEIQQKVSKKPRSLI